MSELYHSGKAYADQLIDSRVVVDNDGNSYPLHSEIKKSEGELLARVITENKCRKGIEIGCAYGISSLYICSALSKAESPSHTILDPFQSEWKSIGTLNLKRAGFDFYTLMEERSEFALPDLLKRGSTFDFAFIDGWHTFDHVLLDFFYINRMLAVGGVVVFHDVDMPSIKRLLRYVLRYPAYELIASIEGVTYPVSWKRRAFETLVLSPLSFIGRLIPSRIVHELLSDRLIERDRDLGLTATMVAIRKISADERDWRWFAEF
jgi:predicted O-methyltransferase YrrM